MHKLVLLFESVAAMRQEVFTNILRGRTFVLGAEGAADRAPCELSLIHPDTGESLVIFGEVVFCQPDGPGKGLGLDLSDLPSEEKFASFIEAGKDLEADSCPPDTCPLDIGPADEQTTENPPLSEEPTPRSSDAMEGDGDELEPMSARTRGARKSEVPGALNLHERIRHLNGPQRDKLARTGTLTERIALERAFGSSVWEALLSNSQLSGAEISRIAKNGNAPTPILSVIASNAGWLVRPEVRRALLSNPRLGAPQVDRVLRATSHAELKLVAQQTAYPARVRQAARNMLKV